MQLKKNENITNKQPPLREGIDKLISLFPPRQDDGFPIIPRLRAIKAEEQCLALFQRHKDELKVLPSQDLKELMSKMSLNCQSKIFHIINCLTDDQIKGLFKTPENKILPNGSVQLDAAKPYCFSGYLGLRVWQGQLDYTGLFEGYTKLRNNHSAAIANLVMKVVPLEHGIENGLFSVSGSDRRGNQSIYEKRLQKITDCFEVNKGQIHKTYGKKVDTPLAWMDAFLKNRPAPKQEDMVLREGIRKYAEKLKLEDAIPFKSEKRSVMKI